MLHALPVFFTQHLNRCQSNVAQFFAIFPPSARWVIFMRTFSASDHVHVPRHLVLTNCALCLCLFLFLLEVPSFTCMFWVAWIRVILVVVGCNKDSQTLVKMVKKRAFLFSVAVWQMKLYMNECHWLFLARGKKKKFVTGEKKLLLGRMTLERPDFAILSVESHFHCSRHIWHDHFSLVNASATR